MCLSELRMSVFVYVSCGVFVPVSTLVVEYLGMSAEVGSSVWLCLVS